MDEQSRGRSRAGIVLLGILVVLVIAAAIGANSWKGELKVQRIVARGNVVVPSAEILDRARIRADERLFDVDLFGVRRRVEANHFIRQASVNREAPGTIAITVVERSPVAVLAAGSLYYVDAEGYVLPPIRSDHLVDLPVLTGDVGGEECRPGTQVTSPAVREGINVLVTAQQMSDELYGRISEVHLGGERDIILYTAEYGVPVVFGRGDAASKLAKLEGFWKEIVLRRGAHALQYVDLRFEDQVVVRWTGGENLVAN